MRHCEVSIKTREIDCKWRDNYPLLIGGYMSEETLTTGEKLIHELDALRIALAKLSDRLNNSGIERTEGLRETQGSDCPYFKKSLDIFVRKDYIQIRDMVESVHNLFRTVEGK
jgi:hypothetical protein